MNVKTSLVPDPASPLVAAFQRARSQTMSLPDLMQSAEALTGAGLLAQAIDLYKIWIAFNEDNPFRHMACFNYAVALRQAGDVVGAIHALQTCLKLDPTFGPAYINLGRAFEDSGQIDQAVRQWLAFAETTKEITPEKLGHRLMSLQHTGRVLENAGRLEEAEAVLWQAIELQPMKPEAAQHWLSIRQHQCKWPIMTPSTHVTARQLVDAQSPLTLGCYADDPVFQLARAHRYNKSLVGRPDTSSVPRKPARRKSGSGQRLRVGYVSSDLRQHAVGFALSEVLELHDKKNVEIFAYYCGDPAASDATQARIKAAVDCWRDIAAISDVDAAKLIASDEIDVLVDVNGYTKHARTAIFAYRPAPVIVNFCGYPGSMASPYHQYLITDDYIIPPENEIYYTEKVLRIACGQPVDRKREIAPRPTRAEAGLPEDAFVYACFNGMQKITEACFARWLAILAATPGSVLWLLGENDAASRNLRQRAQQAGVAPERIIFAPKIPNPRHLARIALADLFLDTFPYGAHSTGADAITMGLPVLTVPGKSFPARFCASIVSAAGIGELICATPEEYVQRAIALAGDRKALAALREKLAQNRETCVLRDMHGLARRLEELFWHMQSEAERGETPVPDLVNLDVYYEIGAELVQEIAEFESEDAYRRRYAERLARWNDFSPLPADTRLWPA